MQRHRLPSMCATTSSLVGLGFFASSEAACMICPDWQYPHCGTCSAIHACCSGWLRSCDKPSMVVIFFPATPETGNTHDLADSPSMWTVQAPHAAMPQPYFVPVRLSVSRNTHSNGVCGSTSTDCCCPFTSNEIAIHDLPSQEFDLIRISGIVGAGRSLS